MTTKRSRSPLDRLEMHLNAIDEHMASAQSIVADLRGNAAIEARAKQTADRKSLMEQAQHLITAKPGLNLTQIQQALGKSHKELRPAIDQLERQELIKVIRSGKRSRLHFLRTQEAIDES